MAKSLRTSSERVELPQEANAIAMMRSVARWIIDFMVNYVILILVVELIEFAACNIFFIIFFCIMFVMPSFYKTFFYKIFLT